MGYIQIFYKILIKVIHLSIVGFMMWHAMTTYDAIKNQNRILLKQKAYYGKFLSLDDSTDSKEKERLYSVIREEEQELAYWTSSGGFSPDTYFIGLIVALLGGSYVVDYLNKKIESSKKGAGDTTKIL